MKMVGEGLFKNGKCIQYNCGMSNQSFDFTKESEI